MSVEQIRAKNYAKELYDKKIRREAMQNGMITSFENPLQANDDDTEGSGEEHVVCIIYIHILQISNTHKNASNI